MPTYEYECSECGHRFEKFQSMTDKPLKKCPECGKKVKRLISSGSGVIFKGSGFYATDYRKGAKESSGACPSAGSNSACSACPGAKKQ